MNQLGLCIVGYFFFFTYLHKSDSVPLYFSMDSGWGVVVCARLLAKLEFSRRCWVYCVPLLVWQVSEAGSCLTVSSLVLWRLMELWLNLPTIINNQGGTASSQQGSTPHTFSPLLTHYTVFGGCVVLFLNIFWQVHGRCYICILMPSIGNVLKPLLSITEPKKYRTRKERHLKKQLFLILNTKVRRL